MIHANHDRKYALILLAASFFILAAGIAVRQLHTKQPQQAKPAIDLGRLQQLTEERRLRDLSTYLSNAANNVSSSLLYLPSRRSSGVVWSSRDAILAPQQAAVPFALVAAKDTAAVIPAFRATGSPAAGDWLLAVARNSGGELAFAHGLYQGITSSRCGSFAFDEVQSGIPLAGSLVGGGVFTLQGQMVGFIAECGDRPIAISISSIANYLKRPSTLNDRLEAAYGMRVDATAAQVQVSTVWNHSAADTAGLQPGDVIRSIDEKAISALPDLEILASPTGEPHRIQLQRGPRRLTVRLNPPSDQAPPTAEKVGLTFASAANSSSATVQEVAKNSPAQRAGILPGDQLRRVGRTSVTDRTMAIRAIVAAGAHPVVLTLARDGKELEVLLAP
jgi:S1-C subfamily serine protease